MVCDYFGKCGSCTLYEQSYVEQLSDKRERVAGLLAPFYSGNIELFVGDSEHYRSRAEFRIWHTGDRCDYAMGNITKDGAVIIGKCPKVVEAISHRMPLLLDEINKSKVLGHKLFGVEFLATTAGESLITLLYHKKLDDTWTQEAKLLESILDTRIIGRARKQKIILTQDYITEKLNVDGEWYTYNYYEAGFTQPNPVVNEHMLNWAVEQAKKVSSGDLLESYCGLGNFTLPLSRHFDKVLATEVSKASIKSAKENCNLNNVENVSFVRMSSEDMVQAVERVRPFRRMEGVDLDSYDFTTALVDPPRAGLDEATTKLISSISHVIYISCNPETLARDLKVLTKTHTIQSAAIFDQFPHTSHIESGVFLVSK